MPQSSLFCGQRPKGQTLWAESTISDFTSFPPKTLRIVLNGSLNAPNDSSPPLPDGQRQLVLSGLHRTCLCPQRELGISEVKSESQLSGVAASSSPATRRSPTTSPGASALTSASHPFRWLRTFAADTLLVSGPGRSRCWPARHCQTSEPSFPPWISSQPPTPRPRPANLTVVCFSGAGLVSFWTRPP